MNALTAVTAVVVILILALFVYAAIRYVGRKEHHPDEGNS